MAIERNYCPGPFSNPNAHAGERDFSFEQWQPPDYRGHYAQLGFLDEPADVEASSLAAWWLAKRDKPLLVFHNKYAQVRRHIS